MTLKKHLHIIKRIVIVQCFVLLFSAAGFAANTDNPEKRVGDTEKPNPEKEKPDSVEVFPTKTTLKVIIPNTSYKPEQFLEQDSINQSGSSVESFNFIQYIIENFKFSEEIF